jgi:hypothetical protein
MPLPCSRLPVHMLMDAVVDGYFGADVIEEDIDRLGDAV